MAVLQYYTDALHSAPRMKMLPARAALAFLVLPGIVAFAVPLLVLRPAGARFLVNSGSAALLAAGTTLLLWCVIEFYRRGRGTLAPWDPPRALVAEGPYRYSRNPMYVGVLLILAGWAVAFSSIGLGLYAVGVGLAFHLRVVLGEEPWLARTHGTQWNEYRRRVPRWMAFRTRR